MFFKISNILQADAEHCQNGIIHSVVSVDANRQIVVIFRYWSVRNEGTFTWTKTGVFCTRCHGPGMNIPDTVLISDGMKGLQNGLHTWIPLSLPFLCEQHLKTNVMLKCGAAMGPVFEELVYAPTAAAFEVSWAKGNARLHDYLGKISREQFSKFYCPGSLHGRTSSQVHFFKYCLLNEL